MKIKKLYDRIRYDNRNPHSLTDESVKINQFKIRKRRDK